MKTPLIKTLLAMLACAMLLCACGQNPEPADEIRFDTEYPVEMKGTTFTAKVLSDNNIPYDPDRLENACSIAFSLYSNTNISGDLVALAASALENLEYLALCHYPEVVYLMLQHYGSN